MPLDAINLAAAREKSIRQGHPSALHLWWARRPLAAARAVIFAQLVNDPEDVWKCQNPGVEPNQQVRGHWTKARGKLFSIIENLVKWENTANEVVLNHAHEAIVQSWRESCQLNCTHPQAQELFNPDRLPGLHDPFAGGGAIPLEAQRLGLHAFASDLNPVAVLINKAMIEIPPIFSGRPPVSRAAWNPLAQWRGPAGLAEDVRQYGNWMREEAFKRVGYLYPTVEITNSIIKLRPDLKEYAGDKLNVIAWIWARTVKSPNPAFAHVEVPLASTFILSSKEGKESYVQPVLTANGYSFSVRAGKAPITAKNGTSFGRQKGFCCVMSGSPMGFEYIREEAMADRIGQRLMAVVAEGKRERVYLSPTAEMEAIAKAAIPEWKPDLKIPIQALGFRVQLYGMMTYVSLFTSRQQVALTTFTDLVREARTRVRKDAIAAGLENDDQGLEAGGRGAKAYSEAVSIYLACIVDKLLEANSSICIWSGDPKNELVIGTFRRQALPMTWDFAEANPFGISSGSLSKAIETGAKVLDIAIPAGVAGFAVQADAQTQTLSRNRFVSTDPPYYDNIGYADLSDFFYIWLRRSLRDVYPNMFATISVPKDEELVASPYRHGTKQSAESFFLGGMTQAMHHLAEQAHPAAPITIYYAFKQSETEDSEGTSNTGWTTFLEAVMKAGLALTGTWPMRTERPTGVKVNNNVLASSIILVCRLRTPDAGTISRRQFVRLLNESLPLALDAMTRESEGLHSPVAPVDLSQAIIGPGMAIFSRYESVLEADGTPMSVKTALQLINRFLAEDDFDPDTQFCLHWFEQHGWEAGRFGEADTLARAKGTSVAGVQHSGVIESGSGNVRLFRWKELNLNWDPASDTRVPIWQVLHQLIQAFNLNGDSGAAKILASATSKAEAARQLAYRLYTLCERRSWAEDARAYNDVVNGWSGIESAAAKVEVRKERQQSLFGVEETK